MSGVTVDGMALAEGVSETIVGIAIADVDGVTAVGAQAAANWGERIVSKVMPKDVANGIEVTTNEDGETVVSVHIAVRYGCVIPEVAAAVRAAASDAMLTQAGVQVASVDVFVDSLDFSQKNA